MGPMPFNLRVGGSLRGLGGFYTGYMRERTPLVEVVDSRTPITGGFVFRGITS